MNKAVLAPPPPVQRMSDVEGFVDVPLPLPCTAARWARLEYIKKSTADYCSEDDEVVEVVRGSVQPWVRLEYMEDLQKQHAEEKG